MSDPAPATLVVGSRGLLGSAVVRRLRRDHPVTGVAVPWGDPDGAAEVVGRAVLAARRGGGDWRLAWCAGAGVTGTGREAIDVEVRVVRRVVDELLGQDLARGSIFVASSAGGVWAGASPAPFTEASPVAPLSSYGHGKLAVEAEVARLTEGGARLAVGRLSNLYGPGQDLAKAQGLISQLCRAQLTGQPVGLYVSLDTVRDYLYVDDAADLVADLLTVTATWPVGTAVTKILASHRSASIAAVLAEVRRVSRRRPVVRLAASPQAAFQAPDLRFRSSVLGELDVRSLTPLPAGVLATMQDLARRLGAPAGV